MAPEPIDLPSDVQSALSRPLSEARTAAAERDVPGLVDAVERVESVATARVPESDLRERLLHGCRTVRQLVDDLEEPLSPGERGRVRISGEYLRSMESLVAES